MIAQRTVLGMKRWGVGGLVLATLAVGAPVAAAPAPPDSTTTTPGTTTTLSPAVIPPITQTGEPGSWQGVQSERRPLAYDVPSTWVVDAPGMLKGFEWEDDSVEGGYGRIIFSGTADGPERGDDGCEATPDATGGFGSNGGESTNTDTAALAAFTAEQWASRAYGVGSTPATVKVGTPVEYTANGLTGHLVKAMASFDCAPGLGEVWVFSFAAPDLVGLYNVVYWADAGALPDATIEAMFASVRESAVPTDGGG